MACKMDDNVSTDTVNKDNSPTDTMSNQPLGSSIRIRIGSRTFSATLLDNPAVTAFKTRLPMTVAMSDRVAGAVKRE
ncbi:cyclophilin-like fold protein [Spirosoma areae]